MEAKKVYWAGDLFDFKDLLGNRQLADVFNRQAAGRWIAVLPQENESNAARGDAIRDDDLERLFTADAVVANFDGTDLDSGTVVEFCFAKFLDLPTVLFRTDFRNSNDPGTCVDPWNLMCSHYPRTETVVCNAMAEYAKRDFPAMLELFAAKILAALDRTAALPPVETGAEATFTAFRRAVLCAGNSMPERFPETRIRAVLAARQQKER